MKTHALLFILLSSFLFSCQNTSKDSHSKSDTDYLLSIPDSLRTPEQKAVVRKIGKVMYENISVRNNVVYFNLSKDGLIAKGIPVQYYDYIQKELITMNKFIKENNISNFDSILKESYKQIRDSLN